LDEIIVPPNRRAIDKDTVRVIADSIKRIGLQQPISVRPAGNKQYLLVTGAHRLEAVRSLGAHMILSSIIKLNEVDARLWEISENLHRADLSKLERSEQVAEWAALTETRLADVSAQVGPKRSVRGIEGEGRPESGIRAASRELGIKRQEVDRSIKIAAITPEAKEAARVAGIDDNQSALLRVAAVPADRQAEVVADIVAQKKLPRATSLVEHDRIMTAPDRKDAPVYKQVPGAIKKAFLARASEAVRLARYDDLESFYQDREMATAAGAAEQAWNDAHNSAMAWGLAGAGNQFHREIFTYLRDFEGRVKAAWADLDEYQKSIAREAFKTGATTLSKIVDELPLASDTKFILRAA
jgi:ParB family transcriptional regulator, chromosome partitioning protein